MSATLDFSEKELIGFPVQANRNLIEISTAFQLSERRIFCYMEVLQSAAAEYQFSGQIIPTQQGRPISSGIPAKLADFTGVSPAQSFGSLLNGGGSPVGDSLVLRLKDPFVAGVTSVVLQPLRINCECDKIIFSLENFRGTNITNARVYLACLSTRF